MAMALAVAAAGSTRQSLSDVNPDGTNHFINKLLFQIYEHFDEQHLIDVTFKLSNPTALVTAHRLVLSAASPYFKQLFKTDQGMCPIMEINNIDADTFERLITFCYTGITVITMDNVDRMLKASLILQLDDAVMTCFNFIMEHMTDYTLQRAYGLESELQCAILTEKILHYETKNFMNVIQNPAFLNFDASKLQKILERDDLNVSTERDAFEAVRRWYEHDVPARQQQLPKIISCLRLTQFDTNFLLSNIQPLPGCHFMALEALTWINIPSSRATISLKFTNSRNNHRAENSDDTTFLALNRYGPNPKSKIIFKYNKSKDLWQKWIDFQMDVVDFATVFMEDNLIFIGGSLNNKIINKVTTWNLKTKTFKQLPPMNEPRRLHCAVILNDKIYAIGGSGTNDNVLRTVEMCSVSHGWKQIKKMTIQRSKTSAVGLNGKMYVMGGYNGRSLKSVECYDPTKNCWSQCADMNEVRCHPSVTVHNGQIFVVGGWKEREASPTVERYDPQRDEWTKIRSLGYGRQLACCISFDNQLWVVGGKNKTLKDSVSVYNEEKCKWSNKTPMPMIGQYYCFTAPKALLESGQRK